MRKLTGFLLILFFCLIAVNGCRYKSPKDVALYGKQVVEKFLKDYKALPQETVEKKYSVYLSSYPVLNKKYTGYQIRLLKWSVIGESTTVVQVLYDVKLDSETKKSNYVFELYFLRNLYTQETITDLRNWGIGWSKK